MISPSGSINADHFFDVKTLFSGFSMVFICFHDLAFPFSQIANSNPGDSQTWGQGGGADANRFLEELMPVARTSTEKLTKLFEN